LRGDTCREEAVNGIEKGEEEKKSKRSVHFDVEIKIK